MDPKTMKKLPIPNGEYKLIIEYFENSGKKKERFLRAELYAKNYESYKWNNKITLGNEQL